MLQHLTKSFLSTSLFLHVFGHLVQLCLSTKYKIFDHNSQNGKNGKNCLEYRHATATVSWIGIFILYFRSCFFCKIFNMEVQTKLQYLVAV